MRRLRENSMLEAEISPTGTVTVEGHHVGELQGFRFTADQSAGGEDAKAVKAAAQKGLAAEFEARAERFSISPNHDIALGSDGVLRWIGSPIGTLTSGEDPLKPRVILLADEQLTGAARDKVAARAERFVGFQIETFLKQLVDLKSAEQLSGIARGIAFRLVENFGLLERRAIADDIKTLDQDGRGALRRLGVRFGAYHLFIPALLKPAPAGLVTLLWALQNDAKDKPGFGDIVHLLASGRTSVVVNQSFEPVFYKLAGFRILGRRAVRVDILERLADLIRPALSWRAGTGTRPDGAFDGAAFMVTPPMMSILGANADDMEEILKGLGYRSEAKAPAEVKAKLTALDEAASKAAADAAARREAEAAAKAAETVASDPVEASVAEANVVDESSDEAIAELTDSAAPQLDGDAQEAAVAESSDDVVEAIAEAQADEPLADTPDAASDETPAEPTESEENIAEEPVIEQAAAESEAQAGPETSASEVSPEAAPPAEPAEAPKPILLWRPQRVEGRPRHRHGDRNRQGRQRENQAQGAPVEGEAADNRGPRQGKPNFHRDRPRNGEQPAAGRGDRPPRHGKPGGRPDQENRAETGGRPDNRGERPNRRPDDRRKDDRPGGDRQKGGKPNFPQKPREERPVRFDPDSPFAKLAALRDQLKK